MAMHQNVEIKQHETKRKLPVVNGRSSCLKEVNKENGNARWSIPRISSEHSDVSSTRESSWATPDSIPIDQERFLRAKQRKFRCFVDGAEREWQEDFFFICMSDTQLGMWNQAQEERMARVSVSLVNKLQPRFVIICGDLINAYADKDLVKRNLEIKRFKEIYSSIDEQIPLVCVCGNHDVGNRPNPFTISQYTENFGEDYFSFWCGGVKCVVLNSQLIKDPSDCQREAQAHDIWLNDELKCEENAIHKLAFMHIPPFINDAEEPEGFFNLAPKSRIKLLEKLTRNEFSKLFCGHYHRNRKGTYKGLEIVVTGAVGSNILTSDHPDSDSLEVSGVGGFACSEEISGLRIVGVGRKDVIHKWYTFAEAKAVFNGSTVAKKQVFEALSV